MQINWHFEVQRNSNAKLIGNEISRRSVDFTGTVPLLTRYQLFPLFGRSWINRLFSFVKYEFLLLDILSVRYLHANLYFGASVLLGRHPALSSSVWTSQIQLWTPRQEVSFEFRTKNSPQFNWFAYHWNYCDQNGIRLAACVGLPCFPRCYQGRLSYSWSNSKTK